MPGVGGLTIRLGLSELGPLGVYLTASLPTGIMLVPQIGLVMNDFAAGVEFFKTLPSIDDPTELRGPDFQLPAAQTPDQWLTSIKQQVVNQYKMIKANPSMNGFGAAFSAPMTITGSAKVYSLFTSKEVFNGQVTVKLSTDGKFLIIGQLNFAADHISVSGRLYADLSRVSQGDVTVLFLADIPDQVRVLTNQGRLKMGFRDASGQEVEFAVPDLPPVTPTSATTSCSRAACRSTPRRHRSCSTPARTPTASGRRPRARWARSGSRISATTRTASRSSAGRRSTSTPARRARTRTCR
jgi:hypothetical protein